MWTPRRIMLLLLGIAGFVGVYFAYSQILGKVDGLPELPAQFLLPEDNPGLVLTPREESPTTTRLREAFGPNSPEVTDTTEYKTRLELRERGIVFACGPMEFTGSPKVTVSPFSIAFFGRAKPEHLLQSGEIREISTFHADKAEIEFDRPVAGPQDLSGKNPAKMIGMDLFSVPDMLTRDPRRGEIEIVNNQKSTDPGQKLVFHTSGPMYYRALDPKTPVSPDVPQVWTHAPVEVIDRKNLPRALRSKNTTTVPTRGEEFRGRDAVTDILLGNTLPPPTMTADGMKIYLDRNDDKSKPEKKNSTGYSSVRLIELTEKVQVNLWSDNGAGFPGSSPSETIKVPSIDPPSEAGSLLGGFSDAVAIARKFDEKTLMVIETLGPFRYDFHASRARFEAAAVANSAVSNHVTVARHSASGMQDNLICKVLVVDFFGGPEQTSLLPAAKPAPGAGTSTNGMKIKSLVATGPHVYISVEGEKLQAQGTELHYTTDPKARRSETLLRGSPVVSERERSRLMAGAIGAPSDVVITSTEPAPGSKDKKQSRLEVRGPGRIEMFDEASKANTLQATWGRSLTQEKEMVGKVEQDLLKFEGGGSFTDTKGEMNLTAERLWLWLAPGDPKTTGANPATSTDSSKMLPQRLLAVKRVEGRNADLIIGMPDQPPVDQLTVWFRDVPPPPPESVPPPIATTPLVNPPGPAVPPGTPTPPTHAPGTTPANPPKAVATAPVPGTPNKEPEKPKPPIKLSARVIESWVVRYPVTAIPDANPKLPKPPENKAGSTTLKYEMERARCEDRVVVHQDPEDPLKNPRGLDISGIKLNMDQSRAGSVMTVYAPPQGEAQVFFESMSLFGPFIVVDQPNNAVSVDGVGKLIMPSDSDASGNAMSRPTEMEIKWITSMRFEGAKSRAAFLGQVQALQRPTPNTKSTRPEVAPQPRIQQTAFLTAPDPTITARPVVEDDGSWSRSWVLCHDLNVTFDRPIYFNNYRRNQPKTAKPGQPTENNPKLKTARCTPMPHDEAEKLPPENARIAKRVYYQEESFDKAGKIVKAQRIDSLQLDMHNDEREQLVLARGPGEVRILQLGSKNEAGQAPTPGPRPITTPPQPGTPVAPATEQEMKLTIVRFTARMTGRDKAKVYQEAIFDDGGRVWQIPTDNLNHPLVEHAPLHERGVYLECSTNLKVSSSKPKKNAQAEQWMTAVGNAMFKDYKYQGNASTIVHDGQATTLVGTERRLAQLWQNRRNITDQPSTNAEQIKYYNDGRIEVSKSGTGVLQPDR